MRPLLVIAALTTILVSGCDLNAQHLAPQGSGGGGGDIATSTPDPHAIQPPQATNPVTGTVASTQPVQRFAVSAGGAPINGSGAASSAITVTFDTPNAAYTSTLYGQYSQAKQSDFVFALNMPTSAKNANYTYRLTGALVTKIQASTVGQAPGTHVDSITLVANTWSWDYQPVSSTGYPTGIAGHGSS